MYFKKILIRIYTLSITLVQQLNRERMATMAGGVVSLEMGEEDKSWVRSGIWVMWNKADRN